MRDGSGEGPVGVVRPPKRFAEGRGPDVAQRIAGLEPEHYTRAGAALRHASASLMSQAASHRLLLLPGALLEWLRRLVATTT